MQPEKEFLKNKFIEFQLKIAELNHLLTDTRDSYEKREKDFILELLTIIDAFENLDKIIAAKQDTFDKSAQRLVKNIRSIQRKLTRLLKTHAVVPMHFPDNMAHMDYCKIVDTRTAPESKNETILFVLKNGYIDERNGTVLRKAEVITVLNDS
jgi:molecular chaperone GrpE (heat shock protein)